MNVKDCLVLTVCVC